MVCEKVGINLH